MLSEASEVTQVTVVVKIMVEKM